MTLIIIIWGVMAIVALDFIIGLIFAIMSIIQLRKINKSSKSEVK